MTNSDSTLASAGRFADTHWSIVLMVGRDTSAQADPALEKLCRIYWQPVYAFVRRRGYPTHDAQDLTQAFFCRLLEKDFLRAVDRKKGKFRSFLLAALEHFLAKEWRRAHAKKRGGRCNFISLDDGLAEEHCQELSDADPAPDKLYERQWAITVLTQVLGKLHDEFVNDGKGPLFEEIKIFLTIDRQPVRYAELAAKLNMTEGALKMAVVRMRRRYGELLRAEIARTVSSPDDIEEELQAFFAAFGA